MNRKLLDEIIEGLEKVDEEILSGTKWSQSVKLNKVLNILKDYRKENYGENTNHVREGFERTSANSY